MTHDELLAEIDDNFTKCGDDCESCRRDNASWFALRAVVELHKPVYWENIHDSSWNGNDCSVCFTDGNLDTPSSMVTYPCETIQAIEKELK